MTHSGDHHVVTSLNCTCKSVWVSGKLNEDLKHNAWRQLDRKRPQKDSSGPLERGNAIYVIEKFGIDCAKQSLQLVFEVDNDWDA